MDIITELCAIADKISDKRGVVRAILKNQVQHGNVNNVREFSYGVQIEMEISDYDSEDLKVIKQFRERLKAHIYGEQP